MNSKYIVYFDIDEDSTEYDTWVLVEQYENGDEYIIKGGCATREEAYEHLSTMFRADFKRLLTQYNASISFNVDDGSDTYGLTGEHMTVETRMNDKWDYHTMLEVCGWGIDKSDIKE